MRKEKLEVAQTTISSTDYKALTDLINKGGNDESLELLAEKLKDAVADDTDNIDIVRLNRVVKLLDHHTNRPMEFQLVLPQDANMKERKVSILTPIGIALIGQRKGEQVMWALGGGTREVTILDA